MCVCVSRHANVHVRGLPTLYLKQSLFNTRTYTHVYAHEAEADISQSVSVHVRNADTVNLGRLAAPLALA